MPLSTIQRLNQRFSVALSMREPKIQDLVTNSNILLAEMKSRGMWKPFSGPTIQVPVQDGQSNTFTRYQAADYLATTRKDLISSAEFEPKMGAVSVVLTNEDILRSNGKNQIIGLVVNYIDMAEAELYDRFNEDLHSAGALNDQISGLQKAIPTDPTSGTYGGIDRSSAANAIWRTKALNVNGAGIADNTGSTATAITPASIQEVYVHQAIASTRSKKGPNLILAASAHFQAYATATTNIQRITNENQTGKLGYSGLMFFGGGRSMPIVLEGGIGSAMPAGISYMMDSGSICFYFHPERKFQQFGGKQMPINQDMMVQHIGFMGELALKNPLHNSKIYVS